MEASTIDLTLEFPKYPAENSDKFGAQATIAFAMGAN
jgi:hypothetical protein